MSEPVRIDPTCTSTGGADEGVAEKEGYQIWEYRGQAGVTFNALAGTVDEVVHSMNAAGIDKAVAANLFSATLTRAALPAALEGAARDKAIHDIDGALPHKLMEFNRWGCEVAAAQLPTISPSRSSKETSSSAVRPRSLMALTARTSRAGSPGEARGPAMVD